MEIPTWENPWEFPCGKTHGIPMWETHGNSHVGNPWEFPRGKPMGIPTWETHGNSHVGKPMGIPTWETHGNSHGKSRGNGMGMGMEISFPRQPWKPYNILSPNQLFREDYLYVNKTSCIPISYRNIYFHQTAISYHCSIIPW